MKFLFASQWGRHLNITFWNFSDLIDQRFEVSIGLCYNHRNYGYLLRYSCYLLWHHSYNGASSVNELLVVVPFYDFVRLYSFAIKVTWIQCKHDLATPRFKNIVAFYVYFGIVPVGSRQRFDTTHCLITKQSVLNFDNGISLFWH